MPLHPARKAELDQIVTKMAGADAPKEDVQAVVNDYLSKYGMGQPPKAASLAPLPAEEQRKQLLQPSEDPYLNLPTQNQLGPESILPTAGAILGAPLGPPGMALGAAGGTMANEGVRQMLTGKPETAGQVLGPAAANAALSYVGGKVVPGAVQRAQATAGVPEVGGIPAAAPPPPPPGQPGLAGRLAGAAARGVIRRFPGGKVAVGAYDMLKDAVGQRTAASAEPPPQAPPGPAGPTPSIPSSTAVPRGMARWPGTEPPPPPPRAGTTSFAPGPQPSMPVPPQPVPARPSPMSTSMAAPPAPPPRPPVAQPEVPTLGAQLAKQQGMPAPPIRTGEGIPSAPAESAISAEEVNRSLRGEVYFRVGKGGATFLGPRPDAGALRPGEGIVKIQAGKAPQVVNSNGPDTEVLYQWDRFTNKAMNTPTFFGQGKGRPQPIQVSQPPATEPQVVSKMSKVKK